MTAGSGLTPAEFVFCLDDGTYSYHYSCSNYCGEHTWTVTDDEGNVLSQGQGSYDDQEQDLSFTVGGAPPAFGCTDPTACNFDPEATEDDGSCILSGDACDCSSVAVLGENSATGGEEWFSYTATTDCNLEITSQNDTGNAEWDTDLYVFNSCSVDEYGYFDDMAGNNDDCCGYYGPSTFTMNVTAGTTVLIHWHNSYGPPPFTWYISENDWVYECVDDSYEDNNNDGVENDGYTTPEPIVEGSYNFQMCAGDHDWYSIMVNNGETLRTTLTDINETGMMDLLLFVLEIDDAGALVYEVGGAYMDIEYSNTLDHPTEFLIAARDYDNLAEGPYTLTVEITAFQQVTYAVSRSSNGGDYVELASDLLVLEYMDLDVEPGAGDTHCYTVSAAAGSATGPESSPPACVEMEFIEPPAPPFDLAAEGTMYDSNGDGEGDTPSVTWSWDYDYAECTDLTIYMYDSWGDGWGNNVLMIGNESFTVASGDSASATICLEDGTYAVTCDGGSWQSEISWRIEDADGWVLLSGGAPYSGELVLGAGRDDGGIAVFNLEDGQNQSQINSRDISFELYMVVYGTPYYFQTTGLILEIYGLPEGSEICGEVAAVENGWYSEWVGPACAEAGGGPSTVDITVDHAEGWNMVSLPVGVEDSSPGALFSGSIGGTLYSSVW
jgi:hypothetical protein